MNTRKGEPSHGRRSRTAPMPNTAKGSAASGAAPDEGEGASVSAFAWQSALLDSGIGVVMAGAGAATAQGANGAPDVAGSKNSPSPPPCDEDDMAENVGAAGGDSHAALTAGLEWDRDPSLRESGIGVVPVVAVLAGAGLSTSYPPLSMRSGKKTVLSVSSDAGDGRMRACHRDRNGKDRTAPGEEGIVGPQEEKCARCASIDQLDVAVADDSNERAPRFVMKEEGEGESTNIETGASSQTVAAQGPGHSDGTEGKIRLRNGRYETHVATKNMLYNGYSADDLAFFAQYRALAKLREEEDDGGGKMPASSLGQDNKGREGAAGHLQKESNRSQETMILGGRRHETYSKMEQERYNSLYAHDPAVYAQHRAFAKLRDDQQDDRRNDAPSAQELSVVGQNAGVASASALTQVGEPNRGRGTRKLDEEGGMDERAVASRSLSPMGSPNTPARTSAPMWAAPPVDQQTPSPLPPRLAATQPGAVQVEGRAVGRLPAWGRGMARASSRLARSVAGSASSIATNSSRQEAGVVVEVAELAPGEDGTLHEILESEAPQRADSVLGSSAQTALANSAHDSPVLEGVPVPSQLEEGGKRSVDAHVGRFCVFRVSKRICFAISIAFIIAVIVGSFVLTRPGSLTRGAELGSEINTLEDAIRQLSSPDALDDRLSPQRMALQWITEDQKFSVLSLQHDLPRLLQRYALSVIFYSTGGPEFWTEKFSFLSPNPECDWRTEGRGVKCNNSSQVVEILLNSNNLIGTLPGTELVAFPHLRKLNLASNQLEGVIPRELASLSELKKISIPENALVGSLMENIGDLRGLRHLNISDNKLNSSIPLSVGMLGDLKYLDFRDNMFSGPIPSTIGNMTTLRTLNLCCNRLSSTIPSSWHSLGNLEIFLINGNELTGPLPVSPLYNQKVRVLIAGDNQLTGTVPSSLGSLQALEFLLLERNQFHGSIPVFLADIVAFFLNENNLSGTIPPAIFLSDTLLAIGLGENNLTGSLPADIGNPGGMLAISAERNELTGTIPSSYMELPKLMGLSLHSNQLSGTIPPIFVENSHMLVLALENNMLNGTVPSSLARLEDLIWLSLARNNLEGDLGSVCAAETSEALVITADCAAADEEVSCGCCQICCDDSQGLCEYHFDIISYVKNCLADGSCNFFDIF